MADVMKRNDLAIEFLCKTGWPNCQRVKIAGDASNRKYDRLTRSDGQSAILMDAAPELGEDVRPFVRIARYLSGIGLSAPEIFAVEEDAGFLLIEDFGDDLFADLMATDPDRQLSLYRASVDVLVDLHNAQPLPLPACDAQWLVHMTEPAFEYYATGSPAGLAAEFHKAFFPLAETINTEKKVTVLRDYHAENLLWLPERSRTAQVGLLDFQDALLGHPAYDLVSILQDARRDVAPEIETEMIRYYLSRTGFDRQDFTRTYALLGVQRNLRILGIFARLCVKDGKSSYIDLVPRVWDYVQRNLSHPDLAVLARTLSILPKPTTDFLEHLKKQCAISR